MRAVVQRVRECAVRVGERETGRIAKGLLVYLGVGRNDTKKDVRALCEKIIHLRVFPDDQGRMNRSVEDVGGGILLVSQFTLFGDVRDGRRPSYSEAAEPEMARQLYDAVLREIAASEVPVASGEFAAHMEVTYTNMGPVTILIDSQKRF